MFERDAVERHAELRALQQIESLDALHLATAGAAGCDFFVTNDKKLLRLEIAGIGRIISLKEALELL